MHLNCLVGMCGVLACCTLLPREVESRRFGACELARNLAGQRGITRSQIPTWVCIATRESQRNTNSRSPRNKYGSHDHGIFQINDKYWCTASGPAGHDCHAKCSSFEDDDISDDVRCIEKIYSRNKRTKRSGFTAWSAYKFCDTPEEVNFYMNGCDY